MPGLFLPGIADLQLSLADILAYDPNAYSALHAVVCTLFCGMPWRVVSGAKLALPLGCCEAHQVR